MDDYHCGQVLMKLRLQVVVKRASHWRPNCRRATVYSPKPYVKSFKDGLREMNLFWGISDGQPLRLERVIVRLPTFYWSQTLSLSYVFRTATSSSPSFPTITHRRIPKHHDFTPHRHRFALLGSMDNIIAFHLRRTLKLRYSV